MKRTEYISQLRRYLEKGGLPKEEMEDALQYYEEIFFEAGEDKEQEIADDLGSPEKLGAQILRDNNINPDGEPEFFPKVNNRTYSEENNYSNYSNYSTAGNMGNPNNVQFTSNGTIAKIILLIIFSPVLIAVFAVVGGIAIAVAAVAFALICGGFFGGIGIFIGGLFMLFEVMPVGILLCGVGLILVGVGGLILFPVIKFLWKLAVDVFNGIINIIRRFLKIGSVA